MTDLSMTDAELAEILGDLESDRAERKESLTGDAPKKIRQAICAFANDLPDHRLPGWSSLVLGTTEPPPVCQSRMNCSCSWRI